MLPFHLPLHFVAMKANRDEKNHQEINVHNTIAMSDLCVNIDLWTEIADQVSVIEICSGNK